MVHQAPSCGGLEILTVTWKGGEIWGGGLDGGLDNFRRFWSPLYYFLVVPYFVACVQRP